MNKTYKRGITKFTHPKYGEVFYSNTRGDGMIIVSQNKSLDIVHDVDPESLTETLKMRVGIKQSVTPIKKVSEKMYENLKKYRRLRDKYFEEHPICEFPACTSKNVTLHHAKGRIASFLTDKRFFKSLCPKHHRFCEENPAEAIKLGLSFKRNDIE